MPELDADFYRVLAAFFVGYAMWYYMLGPNRRQVCALCMGKGKHRKGCPFEKDPRGRA